MALRLATLVAALLTVLGAAGLVLFLIVRLTQIALAGVA